MMAHFYGTLQGNRGSASRLGTKESGLRIVAASWQGAVTVDLDYDAEHDTDIATVGLDPWHGAGIRKELYRGPVGGPTARADAEPESGKPDLVFCLREAAKNTIQDIDDYLGDEWDGNREGWIASRDALAAAITRSETMGGGK